MTDRILAQPACGDRELPDGASAAARVVFCVAMRGEASALRRGLEPQLRQAVVRTGVGPRRAGRAAATPAVRDADAVAVVGIAGALDPSLRTGDIVVADRVLPAADGTGPVACPGARLLAARLNAIGLPTRVGTIATADRLVTGADRRALADAGAVAADTETAHLLSADRAGVAVRVIADLAGEPLLRPATLDRVRQAQKIITLLGPALADWAAAAGEHTVLLAEPRSFCAGVERAIEIVEQALRQRGAPVYVRKQIVHNQYVVRELAGRGAVFVEELEEVPQGATVVFSAHGVSPAVRAQTQARGLDVIDATCPLVAKVHSELRRFSDRGDTVIFIGHAGHEETEGTMGERPGHTVLVQDADDAATVLVPDQERVSYLVQTTLSSHDVEGILEVLHSRFPQLKAPPTDDICYATTNRQEALREVAGQSDLVLVVGSQNSSNSRRLVETAERFGATAHLIDDVDDLDLRWLAGVRTIGLTAGASAPAALVNEVINTLSGLGPLDVQTRKLLTENVHFTLPKEVQGP